MLGTFVVRSCISYSVKDSNNALQSTVNYNMAIRGGFREGEGGGGGGRGRGRKGSRGFVEPLFDTKVHFHWKLWIILINLYLT